MEFIKKSNLQSSIISLFQTHSARVFLKCTKEHNGYNTCERCTIAKKLIRVK